jgi:hypothetical protein
MIISGASGTARDHGLARALCLQRATVEGGDGGGQGGHVGAGGGQGLRLGDDRAQVRTAPEGRRQDRGEGDRGGGLLAGPQHRCALGQTVDRIVRIRRLDARIAPEGEQAFHGARVDGQVHAFSLSTNFRASPRRRRAASQQKTSVYS